MDICKTIKTDGKKIEQKIFMDFMSRALDKIQLTFKHKLKIGERNPDPYAGQNYSIFFIAKKRKWHEWMLMKKSWVFAIIPTFYGSASNEKIVNATIFGKDVKNVIEYELKQFIISEQITKANIFYE